MLIPDCARIFENLEKQFYKVYYPKEDADLHALLNERVRTIERQRSWGRVGRTQEEAKRQIVHVVWKLHKERTGDVAGWPEHLLGPVPPDL